MANSLPIVHEGGLDFELFISEAELKAAVDSLAERINHDYEGREPLFVCVLNGAFLFAADLFRRITLHSQMTFVRLCSYTGLGTSGEVREMMGLTNDEVRDRRGACRHAPREGPRGEVPHDSDDSRGPGLPRMRIFLVQFSRWPRTS